MTTMTANDLACPDYVPATDDPKNLTIDRNGPHRVDLTFYSVGWAGDGIHPDRDARAVVNELLAGADAAAAETESHLRAADAESRHSAALEEQQRLGVEVNDAAAAVDTALRLGEPADRLETRRNKLELDLAAINRRIPILAGEAARLRGAADAERDRLRRAALDDAGRQHREALAEIDSEIQAALAPLLAKREYWLSVGSLAFGRR